MNLRQFPYWASVASGDEFGMTNRDHSGMGALTAAGQLSLSQPRTLLRALTLLKSLRKHDFDTSYLHPRIRGTSRTQIPHRLPNRNPSLRALMANVETLLRIRRSTHRAHKVHRLFPSLSTPTQEFHVNVCFSLPITG